MSFDPYVLFSLSITVRTSRCAGVSLAAGVATLDGADVFEGRGAFDRFGAFGEPAARCCAGAATRLKCMCAICHLPLRLKNVVEVWSAYGSPVARLIFH